MPSDEELTALLILLRASQDVPQREALEQVIIQARDANRYREALEYYATTCQRTPDCLVIECGKRARQALERETEK